MAKRPPPPRPWRQYTEVLMLRLSPAQLKELEAINRELHGDKSPLSGCARRLLLLGMMHKRAEMLRGKSRGQMGVVSDGPLL